MVGRGKRLLALVALASGMTAAGVGVAHAVEAVVIRPGGAMSMRGTLRIEGGVMECNVTLTGSYSTRTVPITGEGAVLGSVTALSHECVNAEIRPYAIRAVLGLPWNITLRKLNGVNPRFAPWTRLTSAAFQIPGVALQLYDRFGIAPTCLYGGGAEAFEITPTLRATREGFPEYTTSSDTERFQLRTTSGGECTEEFFRAITFNLFAEAPSPTQTFAFGAGGEVAEALSPSPVEFGRLGTETLARRSVTISSTRGGRIESIQVSTGRYFAVTDPNGCRGSTLPEGGSCTFDVLVSTPAEAGRALSDTLTVTVAFRRFEATLRAST